MPDVERVQRMFDRPDHRAVVEAGEAALARLREAPAKIQPLVEDDRLIGWERV